LNEKSLVYRYSTVRGTRAASHNILGDLLLRYSCSVLLGSVLLGSVLLGSVLLGSVLLGSVLLGSVLLRSELRRSELRRSELLRSVLLGRRKRVLRSVSRYEGWRRRLHSIPSHSQMPKAEKSRRVAKLHQQQEGKKWREKDLRYSCHFLTLRLLWIE
jgi:hypothetical protein